jgi:RimJ/RimL family protein N-acetyltransferase
MLPWSTTTHGNRIYKATRIFATCAVEHGASARVLEKAGLRRRTVLHHYKEAKGRWWDMWLYDLTRADWQPQP